MYQYAPPDPQKFPPLVDPKPGVKGHFDHHEWLEKKVNHLETHTGVQITEAWQDLRASLDTLQTTLDTLVTQVGAMEARIATLESKVP